MSAAAEHRGLDAELLALAAEFHRCESRMADLDKPENRHRDLFFGLAGRARRVVVSLRSRVFAAGLHTGRLDRQGFDAARRDPRLR